MVFQSYALYPHLTVYENIAFGLRIRKTAKDEIDRRVREAAEVLGLTQFLDRKPRALSGGQRKLLEMARSLMADPKLIMLDEPMAGVNPALTQSLLGHVKRLRAEGITVMFVEHDMDVVRDISDWVVVMAEGEVIAEGPPESIGANPAVVEAYLGSAHAALTEQVVHGEVPTEAEVREAREEGDHTDG